MDTVISISGPVALRGAATRERLLDSAEALLAEHGFSVPSHRMIAGHAGTHVALVNYHFSSKEMLFEAAVERRAGRLADAWMAALQRVCSRGAWSVEDVLSAWWHPFSDMPFAKDPVWGNYLCVVARMATAADGEAWDERYFGMVHRAFAQALADAMPGAAKVDIEAGFRYARSLFGEVLLFRCGKIGGACRPRGFQEDDIERLISFLCSGLRGLSGDMAAAAD